MCAQSFRLRSGSTSPSCPRSPAARRSRSISTEEDLKRDYPEFELGAVPPLGGAYRDPVVVDRRLGERESLVLEAGSHDESVGIATADLLRIAEAQLADICEE
jgi:prolyl-tRNA editing enzyme YbaK/EbsC (Cys-tRNA(Pro) deacylase)